MHYLFSHLLQLFNRSLSISIEQYGKTASIKLPLNHCVCVHDFSENNRCTEVKQLQTSYFQKTEVLIHVTILQSYALLDIDGVESSENPEIVTELLCNQ